MVKKLAVELSHEQIVELTDVRDRHPKPYMRERAASVLKVAAGLSVRQVALHGLLKPHEPETVSHWIELYLSHGLSGWAVKSGRGRKAGFFPSVNAGGASGA